MTTQSRGGSSQDLGDPQGGDHEGAVGMVAIMAVAALMAASVVVIDLAHVVIASQRAQAAADMAVLAAATVVPLASDLDQESLSRADTIARANGGQLIACRCRHDDAVFEATIRMPVNGFLTSVIGLRSVQASAQATPVVSIEPLLSPSAAVL